MFALDAVNCSNAYTDAATLGPVFGSTGGYFIVAGNDAYVQLGYGRQGQWQWMNEVHMPVGNGILLQGTVAVRFRNHSTGKTSTISAALATAAEPPPFATLSTPVPAQGSSARVASAGKKTSTTPGTAVALAVSTPCLSVSVKPLLANTGTVYLGGAGVTGATGYELGAGDALSVDIDNVASVFMDVAVSGEGVSFFVLS